MLPFRVFLRGIGKGSNLSRRGSLRSINKRSHLPLWFPPLSGEDTGGVSFILEDKRGVSTAIFSPFQGENQRGGFNKWKPHPSPLLRGEGEVFPLSGEFVFHFPPLSGEDKRRGFHSIKMGVSTGGNLTPTLSWEEREKYFLPSEGSSYFISSPLRGGQRRGFHYSFALF